MDLMALLKTGMRRPRNSLIESLLELEIDDLKQIMKNRWEYPQGAVC